MFRVGDRVILRYLKASELDYNPKGTVVEIIGRWVTVKHDPIDRATSPHRSMVGPRYDYQPEELIHENPLLRLSYEA